MIFQSSLTGNFSVISFKESILLAFKEIHWVRQGLGPVWSDWLVVCDCNFQSVWPLIPSLSAYLGFLLPWMWGLPWALLQQSAAPASYLGRGVAPLCRCPCPRARGSSSLSRCCAISAATIWQQIWKTQQWPQDWKRSVFIPIPKKGNAKKCSNYRTIALISHASKVMLKILQARLQQYMNCKLPDVQAGFRKVRGTRDQIAYILWIIEKAREFQKNIYFCFID